MLKTRIFAALVFAPVLFVLLIYGDVPLLCGVIVICCLMHYEMVSLLQRQATRVIRLGSWGVFAYMLSCTLGLMGRLPAVLEASAWVIVALLTALFASGDHAVRIRQAALLLLSALYTSSLLPNLYVMRQRQADGLLLCCIALFSCWAGDTGAYFSGRAFGRRKLFLDVSPSKTIEGALGGLVSAQAASFVLWSIFAALSHRAGLGVTTGYVTRSDAVMLGAVAACFGTLGDLCESLIKRSVGKKDSSGLIPGHGGVLDRFDGVLFCAAATNAYAQLIIDGRAF